MSSIKVTNNVSKSIKLLKSVSYSIFISCFSLRAFLVTHIGGKVWEGIRFDNSDNRDIWIFGEFSNDLVDILSFVCVKSLRARVVFTSNLAVGGEGGAISIRKIVDYKHWDVS
jgi:hypothetical protein